MLAALHDLGWVAWTVWMAYVWCFNFWCFAHRYRKPSVFHSFLCELRWAMLIASPVKFAVIDWPGGSTGFRVWSIIMDVIWVYIAWRVKDDRWKKRREKAAARVKEVAGRLVVVPVPA